MPLAQFFGTGYNRHLYESLPMGTSLGTSMPGQNVTEGWFMYCYFPMPFAKGARIEIENLNRRKIGILFCMRVDRETPPEGSLRFNVRSHTENPCKTRDFPVLEATGAGRLVGCVLNVDCPREQWWGAGDHKLWVDGEKRPSFLGTSTEGYFGSVPGLAAKTMPLHGATLVSPVGKNSAYRWHVADSVAFSRSLRFTLENLQTNGANDVYYNTVVYWYGEPGADASFTALSNDALELPGLRIPGAVEIEGNIVGSNWGRVLKQKYAGAGLEFSGKLAATITTTAPVQVDIPCDQPGTYELSLRVRTGRSFGTVKISAADADVGTVEYSRESDGVYKVGLITLTKGKNRVSVTCDRTTTLDCWILKPVKE